ncbi:MFS transporter [Longispora sp. NPDC051575]|uniref:MFS transporter n=1 Tax=Longispora sp. NPDC051575 TaxID=3154943 RepID=UPI00342F5BC6
MAVWESRTYRHLFTAQVLALTGTGLATVALGLTAYRLAGPDAGLVLSTALAIKMVAYVALAPLVTALADRVPRRALLVSMDLLRMAVAAALPFVGHIWQVYVLIAVLQSASAAFTPAFQATIPAVLPDEADYTRALSLSRLAYDLESLASPVLAGVLLALVDARWLFTGTALGFAASATLILAVALPTRRPPAPRGGLADRATRGLRMFTATPRLRAVIGVDLAVAAAGAMVLVNTVVIVRGHLGGSDPAVALALGVSGAGSIAAALLLPRVLTRVPDRTVMLGASAVLASVLAAAATLTAVFPGHWWPVVLGTWALVGAAGCLAQTPVGRLIRRSGHPDDLPALFAAQFTLSHLGWLATYVLAGVLGALSVPLALAALATVALTGLAQAWRTWPAADPDDVEHVHTEPDPHHLADATGGPGAWRHTHRLIMDDRHRAWPRPPATRPARTSNT